MNRRSIILFLLYCISFSSSAQEKINFQMQLQKGDGFEIKECSVSTGNNRENFSSTVIRYRLKDIKKENYLFERQFINSESFSINEKDTNYTIFKDTDKVEIYPIILVSYPIHLQSKGKKLSSSVPETWYACFPQQALAMGESWKVSNKRFQLELKLIGETDSSYIVQGTGTEQETEIFEILLGKVWFTYNINYSISIE
jgi:hypothetical protein